MGREDPMNFKKKLLYKLYDFIFDWGDKKRKNIFILMIY